MLLLSGILMVKVKHKNQNVNDGLRLALGMNRPYSERSKSGLDCHRACQPDQILSGKL